MTAGQGVPSVLLVFGWSEPDHGLVDYLRGYGWLVTFSACALEVPALFPDTSPDLCILTLDLADPRALSTLVKMRELYQGPLTVLAPQVYESVQILALELGADDFISGAVSHNLIFARAKALLRCWHGAQRTNHSTIVLGGLTIDAARREVQLQGAPIEVTTLEFDLLWYLARNAGTVVSRNDIHQTIYNREYNGIDRSIDMYISRLRQKLGDDQPPPRLLKTVRGTGYLLSGQLL